MKHSLSLLSASFATLLVAGAVSSSHVSAQATGRQAFRYDTFGDEQFWTDTLRMHEALASVNPMVALSVGLKVDAEALPPPLVRALQSGELSLTDPAVTRILLQRDAVVGLSAKVSGDRIRSVGITCALCHSTVDNSFQRGIGRRLDGWANRDLNVGAIVSLSPAIGPALREELGRWGPGKYDPRHHAFDGTQLIGLNSPSIPVVIPPAFGLQGVGFETVTGDGPISYWNSYVGVGQMGGEGNFSDPRINLTIAQQPDRVTPKLAELLAYQLSLEAPRPPAGSFNAAAAARGQQVFNGAGRCASCHVPPTYTDVMRSSNPATPLLHAATEVGADPAYAARSATAAVSRVPMYRTTPLRGIWQHPPYFHDGSATDLAAVVSHYEKVLQLVLTPAQKADLIEFLKSL